MIEPEDILHQSSWSEDLLERGLRLSIGKLLGERSRRACLLSSPPFFSFVPYQLRGPLGGILETIHLPLKFESKVSITIFMGDTKDLQSTKLYNPFNWDGIWVLWEKENRLPFPLTLLRVPKDIRQAQALRLSQLGSFKEWC